jgi:NADPH:quinone reductase-like Zn-dependent oxidoreductase
MKAFALTSADQPATLVDLPEPVVPTGGVRVRVTAASVNGFDVYQASGYLASMMEHEYPTVIGRDFAGVVDAVADGRTDVSVGDEVAGLVQDGGRIATTLGAADVDALAARGVRATNISGTPTVDKLTAMAEQAAAGTLRVEIEKTFPLTEVAAALAAFGAGKRGKIVIEIG